jgi:hypothetical protein
MVMSIILDGMDQNNCKMPHLGSQDVFPAALKQVKHHIFVAVLFLLTLCVSYKKGITGVKEHGVGVFLYRTINTVKKGADLTIYCILTQLELHFKRHGQYPEKLYVQVDGGSENANQYLLAALEMLVIKRMIRAAYFTRLPTGIRKSKRAQVIIVCL